MNTEIKDFEEMIFDLKSILQKRKITPYRLSKLTGIKFDTIYHYCNSQKIYRIDLYNLTRICTTLRCSASDIIKYKKIQN